MTNSMAEVIEPGDFVLVWRMHPFQNAKKGSIYAFKTSDLDSTVFIKRMVAIPGSILSPSPYFLAIDGSDYPHDPIFMMMEDHLDSSAFPYLSYLNIATEARLSIKLDQQPIHNQIVIPSSYYFMIGDNYYESMDSRFWGYIHGKHIIGKVVAIF